MFQRPTSCHVLWQLLTDLKERFIHNLNKKLYSAWKAEVDSHCCEFTMSVYFCRLPPFWQSSLSIQLLAGCECVLQMGFRIFLLFQCSHWRSLQAVVTHEDPFLFMSWMFFIDRFSVNIFTWTITNHILLFLPSRFRLQVLSGSKEKLKCLFKDMYNVAVGGLEMDFKLGI